MKNLLLGNIPNHNKLVLDLPNYGLIDSIEKKFVTFGSCFASSVSRGLWRLGFDTYFSEDTCFHYSPNSISQFLKQINYSPKKLEDFLIQLEDGRYKSIATRYISERGQEKSNFCDFLFSENQKITKKIIDADYIIITLGNATYQRLLNSNQVLCHGGGLPQELYEIIKTPYYSVLEKINECIEEIKKINKKCKIILTVSPQRYGWLMNANLATGINEILDLDQNSATNWLINSNLDKSKLRLAIDEVIENNCFTDVFYFPAYEIVMDELRDYEGFNHDVKDLMHVSMPNTPNYVINKFLNSFCSDEVKNALEFYRSTLDILIDGYPARLKKMSKSQAEYYISEKIPVISHYIKSIHAVKLANYVLKAIFDVFPEETKLAIKKQKIDNLHIQTELNERRIENLNLLTDETICVIGYSAEFDTLCKKTCILKKRLTRIISPNLDMEEIYSIPIQRNLDQLFIDEQVVIVIDHSLLNHPEISIQLENKVKI